MSQMSSSQVAFNKSNDNHTACTYTYKPNKKVIIKNTMSREIQKKLIYSAQLIYTIADWDHRCDHTVPKIHLLIKEFLKRVVWIWGRV